MEPATTAQGAVLRTAGWHCPGRRARPVTCRAAIYGSARGVGQMDSRSLWTPAASCRPAAGNALVGYYARTSPVRDADHYSYAAQDLVETIRACRPDVLLLWGQPSDAASWRRLLNQHAELKMRLIPPQQLPPSCQKEEGLVVAVSSKLSGGQGLGLKSPRTAPGGAGRTEESHGRLAAASRPSPRIAQRPRNFAINGHQLVAIAVRRIAEGQPPRRLSHLLPPRGSINPASGR